MLLAVCINPYFDSPAAISAWQALHLVPLSFTATAYCDSFPKQRPQRASSRRHISAPSSKEELAALTAVPTAVVIKKQWRLKTQDFLLLVPVGVIKAAQKSQVGAPGDCPKAPRPGAMLKITPLSFLPMPFATPCSHAAVWWGFHRLCLSSDWLLQSFRGRSSSFGQHLRI